VFQTGEQSHKGKVIERKKTCLCIGKGGGQGNAGNTAWKIRQRTYLSGIVAVVDATFKEDEGTINPGGKSIPNEKQMRHGST